MRGKLGQKGLKCRAIVSFMIAFLALTFAPNQASSQEARVVYSKVRIQISGAEEIVALARAGLVLDHIHAQDGWFEAVLNGWELEILKKTSADFEILVPDLEADFSRAPRLSEAEREELETQMQQQFGVQGFGFGSMGGYYTFSEIVAELDLMRSQYPDLISARASIGQSIEGREIWMVKISDNPEVDESEEEILYTALTHTREPQGMATVLFFMFYLLENYGTDPNVTFLVDNRELYFIPVVNPDGYVYNESTNPNGGGFWRKNRRDNGGGVFGVDLNRNYGYKWGFDNIGSSPSPFGETYRGTGPFSEPETQAVRVFANSRTFSMAFNYHTYSNLLIFPFGYQANHFTPDHALYLSLSQDMTQFNNYVFGTANQTVGYLVNGESTDWFYGEQTEKNKVIAFVPEVGSFADGFWPNINRIFPLAVENVYSNLVLAQGLSGSLPATLSIVMNPDNPPINIPAGGGNFSYTVTLSVASSGPQTFDIWNLFTKPGGGSIGPTIGPVTVTLGGGFNRSVNLTQSIPAGAPSGDYTYSFNAGTYPGTVLSSSKIGLTKSSAVAAAKAFRNGANDWAVLNSRSNQPWDPAAWVQSLTRTNSGLPESYVLEQNYPNPFNPTTTISFELPRAESVRIVIYDLRGRQVRRLVNERRTAGRHRIDWNGENEIGQQVATGIYLYKIEASQFVQTRRMVLLR